MGGPPPAPQGSGRARCAVFALVTLGTCPPAELRRAHEQEKLLLAETHHRSQEALQETVEALRAQLKSFQERMKRVEESLLSRDYKKHIEEHGSPSPFWEQELESLHFVIEMKNEHIHGLDKKLLNLEAVVGSERGVRTGFALSVSPPHLNIIQKLQLSVEGTWAQQAKPARCHPDGSPMDGGIGGLGGNEELAGGTSSPLLTPAPPLQAERNLLLEEKLKTLQQENEDLQARTQNHLVMTR
ncbi:Coiled-coil domain-containing protein 69 [Aix galericulata]|nr:Coiled-coil domain-containing protein 69 [Aix galericulata]